MMNSREKILAAVKNNQPSFVDAPTLPSAAPDRGKEDAGKKDPAEDLASKFTTVLESIGGNAFIVHDIAGIASILREQYPHAKRIISVLPEEKGTFHGEAQQPANPVGQAGTGVNAEGRDAHSLADVDLALIRAHFGVAENAACWITEDLMTERALPFICEHLAVVIDKKDIAPTMHEAYERIGTADYGFGTFIAGPSKTADIEQSLVLGAHGPKSMIVFIIDPQISDEGFY